MIAYIGIGSNLGDRKENCLRAIRLLRENGIDVIKESSLYETEPWGVEDQPRFINMVVMVETTKPPMELLNTLKSIESEMGRKPSKRWGPRLIDLDILLYGDLVLSEDVLKIPHPLLEKREFVLIPLSEIAPDLVHPISGKTIAELLKELRQNRQDT